MVDTCGPVKLGRKTKELCKRLRPGDIAIIDHTDLDEVAADGLIRSGVRAVVNAAPCITGRYPNTGPRRLLEAGIPVFDRAGADVFSLAEGSVVRISPHGTLTASAQIIAQATPLTLAEVESALAAARHNLAHELEHFIENTIDFARREKAFVVNGLSLPPLRTDFFGRHALVVIRGHSYRDDLAAIRPYIEEMNPVLVGVDGGADALIEAGFRPDVVVGDMDSVSDTALVRAAEIIVHAYPDGRAPGAERVRSLGLEPKIVAAPGTSEDIALLLAYETGAELIVAVGAHSNLVDFMDKGRPGMASTFLVRLKVGNILVDAKGVSRLYRRVPRMRYLAEVSIAALIPILLTASLSQPLRQWIRLVALQLRVSLGF